MFSYEYNADSEYFYELEKRMQQCKRECLDALAGIVHPEYINKFAGILAYAYDQEDEDAITIAKNFNLDELNFLAVLDRKKDFENVVTEKHREDFWLSYQEEIL